MASIEEYKSLDIRFLDKNNLLRPGHSFRHIWTSGGKPSGEVMIEAQLFRLVLSYTYTRDGKSEKVEQEVPLDQTDCNYGWFRSWFLCPGCGRRVAVLILGGKLFLCRHCYGLKYCSQLETDLDRANRKVWKLQDRLDRKGLHQKTRHRLWLKLIEAKAHADKLFKMGAAKILKRLNGN
jgi:hypothetical protein